ncbi:MAG TPA: hypothetical protein VLT32_06345 [Candidatus Sulfomarinibacteraceae bacterium]|nr:hypothetical protein [Candidatus Sulfomarinibacteraceae bacterium]
MSRQSSACVVAIVVAAAMLAAAPPAAAQRDFEPLFDKFNLRLEGSLVQITTEIRLDSEMLGRGTTLNFEDDLDLDDAKLIPSLSFEWQIARRHKLGVRWQDISRDSNAQALEEITWGDEVIPVDADIALGFDIVQYFVDYAYYPWVKERWAAGFGLGVRWMEISANLDWSAAGGEIEGSGSTDAQGTGPLPYLYFEYRRLLSDHWRFKTGLGWLAVEFDDIDGSQYVGKLDIEYLAGRRWGFGAALNFAKVDVDWAGLENEDGEAIYTGAIDMDIGDVTIFVRLRF